VLSLPDINCTFSDLSPKHLAVHLFPGFTDPSDSSLGNSNPSLNEILKVLAKAT